MWWAEEADLNYLIMKGSNSNISDLSMAFDFTICCILTQFKEPSS